MGNRKFVVVVKEETSEDISSFLKYIKEQDFGWWHWVSNVWLLTTYNKRITAGELRDKFRDISGNKTVVVLEVQAVTWATFGPTGEDGIAKWIRDNWKKL